MTTTTTKKMVKHLKEIEQTTATIAKPDYSQLVSIFRQYAEKEILIAMRGYPDPDSIASALAITHLTRQYKINATILYFDDISHYENRALVKQLDIQMVRYVDGFNFEPYHGIILVDSQIMGIPNLENVCPILAIIDHHKLQGDLTADYIDIREDVGSTCTIIAEYIQNSDAEFTLNNPDHNKIATAMLIGIRSDTDDFFNAYNSDFSSAAYLAKFADKELLRQISNQSISPATMEITQRAFANRIINDTFIISGVGFVRDDDRDSIGQAADYLLRREGIDNVIVYGIVNDQFVDGSLRTKSTVVDPDRFLKDVFGHDPYGTAFGGGRRDKGAFKIPLGPFAACTNRELLWRFVKHTVEDLVFAKLGIDRED